MKFRITGKDLLIFLVFAILLLYLCAIAVANITSFSHDGTFSGLNPIPALVNNLGATLVLFFIFLITIFLSVSKSIFERKKGVGFEIGEKNEKGYSRWSKEKEIKNVQVPKNNDTDIIVEGIDKIKVSVANCCNPLPGDEIIGYITRNNGITVHKSDCPNLENLDDRMVTVRWNEENTKYRYLATILVYLSDTEKAMLEIMQKASVSMISIDNIKTLEKGDTTIYEVDLWVKSLEH